MACSLTFGLKTPYVVLPVGFGLIFHTIVKDQISANGYNIELGEVWRATWILGLAMVIGLFIAIFITYKKDRDYEDLPLKGMEEVESEKWKKALGNSDCCTNSFWNTALYRFASIRSSCSSWNNAGF